MEPKLLRNGTLAANGNSKLRNIVAGLSSGPVYYDRPETFSAKVSEVLREYGLMLYIPIRWPSGSDRSSQIPILPIVGGPHDATVCNLFYTWHRMQSGRWEMCCYLS